MIIFHVNLEKKLKFTLKIHKFGLSFIDSTPKEFVYLEIERLKLTLKKINDFFDIRLSILDFQVL